MNFQDFSYPYFKLTRQALIELELAHPDEEPPLLVHYFNPDVDYWIKTKVDSTIIVASPGQRLFFKATNVKSFPSFDRLYARTTLSLQHQPNLRTMLTQEHQRAKRKLVETELRAHTRQLQSREVIDLSLASDVEDDASTIVGDLTPRPHSQKLGDRLTHPPGPTGEPHHVHEPLRLPSSRDAQDTCGADGEQFCCIKEPTNDWLGLEQVCLQTKMTLYLYIPILCRKHLRVWFPVSPRNRLSSHRASMPWMSTDPSRLSGKVTLWWRYSSDSSSTFPSSRRLTTIIRRGGCKLRGMRAIGLLQPDMRKMAGIRSS